MMREDILTIRQETEKSLEVGGGRCGISFVPVGKDTTFFPSGCCPEICLIIYIYRSPPQTHAHISSQLCPGLPYFRTSSSSISIDIRILSLSECAHDILKVASNPINYGA